MSNINALKYDQGFDKLPWHLFPYDAGEGVVRVLLYGKRKYTVCIDCNAKVYPNPRLDGDKSRDNCPKCESVNIANGAHNWRKGFDWIRLLDSQQRHLKFLMTGHDIDDESGLPHIDHLACTAMFLSEHQKFNLGKDNRFKYEQLVQTASTLV